MVQDSDFSASIESINQFLMKFKSNLYKGVEFVPRTYNGITSLGLDITLATRELYSLTYHNYDRGPTDDRNGDGTEIWEFGKLIDEELVYIKVKLQNDRCKVISFKPSHGPFTLPFKNW